MCNVACLTGNLKDEVLSGAFVGGNWLLGFLLESGENGIIGYRLVGVCHESKE